MQDPRLTHKDPLPSIYEDAPEFQNRAARRKAARARGRRGRTS